MDSLSAGSSNAPLPRQSTLRTVPGSVEAGLQEQVNGLTIPEGSDFSSRKENEGHIFAN